MIAALTAAVLAGVAPPAAPCGATLPTGPAVPAPLVFTTTCGSFGLDPSGRVNRLPRRVVPVYAAGTGRRFNGDLRIRRNPPGRIFLLRGNRLVWRSNNLYARTGGDVAFGPNVFAFASYYRGIFLTDLRGPERLVFPGRGRYPYAFFASGRLIVTGGRAIVVLSPRGAVERRYPYRRHGGYTFDERRNTLLFVTPRGRMATLREADYRVGRLLKTRDGMITLTPERRLLFYGARSLTLASLDGRVLAHAGWPRGGIDSFDAGASISSDGRRVAFRLSDARAGAKSGNAIVFLLRAGQSRARPIYRHRLGAIGCGAGATMRWHGPHLLYSSTGGPAVVIDTRTGRRRDLTALANALPRRQRTEDQFVSWARDFR